MALLVCSECGGKVSDKAEFCPHCGCPQNHHFKADLGDFTGQSNTTENESTEFSAGVYIVGEDLSAGKYNVIWMSGSGTFIGNNNIYICENFGDDSTYCIKQYKNAVFKNSDSFEITGNLVVKFINKSISPSQISSNGKDDRRNDEYEKNSDYDEIACNDKPDNYNGQPGRLTSYIAAGLSHTVWLNNDGTVNAVGDNDYGQCNIYSWENIISLAAGDGITVGLRNDGTVVAVGKPDHVMNILKWKDITYVAAGDKYILGIKNDGTVVATGYDLERQCNVSNWEHITSVSTGKLYEDGCHTVGLKTDGTVVVAGFSTYGRIKTSTWSDIVAVSAGSIHTVGLKKDGTVVATGFTISDNRCDVSSWKNVVSISAGSEHTVGLKKDGSVLSVGSNEYGQCEVSKWKNIISIVAGNFHTIGLKNDGTIVTAGNNSSGQCITDIKKFQEFFNEKEKYKRMIAKTHDELMQKARLSRKDYFDLDEPDYQNHSDYECEIYERLADYESEIDERLDDNYYIGDGDGC